MKKSRLLGAVCIGTFAFITTTASAVILPLESRLGGLAYYDSNLNITWVADANAGAGSSFDDGSTTTDGAMTWASADAWVASLTIASVGGWRLPSADVNGDGTVVDCNGGGVTDCFDNEMGYLFWEEGITSAAQFPFANIQANRYWTGTGSASAPLDAWFFRFGSGIQSSHSIDSFNFAWAVADGDVFVPLPPALYLFGSGLLGLVGIARRRP